MPFPIYDRETLLRFILSTLRNRLNVNPTKGTLWYKLADAWADVLVTVSGHQQHIVKHILPETADTEALERHARVRGLLRKQAKQAEGTVSITLVEK